MKITTSLPTMALRDSVLRFQQREAHLTSVTILFPIPARFEQLLEFYLKDRYVLRPYGSVATFRSPSAVIVGPSTQRNVELVLHGRLEMFTVHFQPSGFHQLFGLPMPELTDQGYEAHTVIGSFASEMQDRLAAAATFLERVQIANAMFLKLAAVRSGANGVAKLANRVIHDAGRLDISGAARDAGLGVRQFERKFTQQVGITPKLYARIVRFQAALEAKVLDPRRSWADVAHTLGYFDQMHMVHDFQQFADQSPATFLKNFTSLPEPW